jgi:hypothetical protein
MELFSSLLRDAYRTTRVYMPLSLAGMPGCCTSEFQTLINAERYQRGKQQPETREIFPPSLSLCLFYSFGGEKHAEICALSATLGTRDGSLFTGKRAEK